MPYLVPIEEAKKSFPQFEFVSALTPSEQKAAFHVRDAAGRHLCLKIIAPTYSVDRVNREITALQQIANTHVVRFEEYTYSSKGGSLLHYMVEEFVDGVDLATPLAAAPWTRPRIGEFFGSLCDGLEALRAAGVVHRDLKPNNIRVRPDGQPVIVDFGLVRVLSLPDLTKTADGAAIGTPLYFAPEQFEGTKREIDHRTDLFALGVLLYLALTGRHPFYTAGITLPQLQKAVCEGADHLNHALFRALPNRWQVLLRSLLAHSRIRRPQTAAQVGALLATLGAL
jgi:eukaryotic-like serine/threonine-protein kinase